VCGVSLISFTQYVSVWKTVQNALLCIWISHFNFRKLVCLVKNFPGFSNTVIHLIDRFLEFNYLWMIVTN
jgi:hypothetical protein